MNQNLWLTQQLNEQRQLELKQEAQHARLVLELRANEQVNKSQSAVARLFKLTRS